MIGKKEFVLLVDQKSEMLYRVARTILRNDEDCKDALQEAMLKSWESRHKLRDITMFGTWITRILINECHTLMRKKRKYLLKAEMESSSPCRAADPALQLALESLPERWRLPLVLHYLEGYTYEQIAKLLHLTQSTVRSRLSHGRDALRKTMEGEKEAWLHEMQ